MVVGVMCPQAMVIGARPNEPGSAWRFSIIRPWLRFWTGIFLRLGLGFWTASVTGWKNFEDAERERYKSLSGSASRFCLHLIIRGVLIGGQPGVFFLEDHCLLMFLCWSAPSRTLQGWQHRLMLMCLQGNLRVQPSLLRRCHCDDTFFCSLGCCQGQRRQHPFHRSHCSGFAVPFCAAPRRH